MLIKKIILFFIIQLLFYNFAQSKEVMIISKVDNEIITNIDIEIEKNYLLLLNSNLSELSKNEFFILAKNSLVREIIKKKEINKSFSQQSEITKNKIIENFYNRLGFDKKNKFIKFLDKKNISFESLKEKLIIEALWNQLIYIKFNDKIRIDKNSIKNEIIDYFNSKDKKYEYNLSEITIDIEKDINLKKKEILKYIEKFGFEIAANKYSKSDTSKYGGEIGWIKSTRLSKKIKKKISMIKIGEITKPIQTPNGYLFLKLNDKREIVEKLDLEKELKQQINFEKNRQLNQFSLIYYKKLKKSTNIYENK
jgi:peptidyl-prolyl cis-trans isomerase SurA